MYVVSPLLLLSFSLSYIFLWLFFLHIANKTSPQFTFAYMYIYTLYYYFILSFTGVICNTNPRHFIPLFYELSYCITLLHFCFSVREFVLTTVFLDGFLTLVVVMLKWRRNSLLFSQSLYPAKFHLFSLLASSFIHVLVHSAAEDESYSILWSIYAFIRYCGFNYSDGVVYADIMSRRYTDTGIVMSCSIRIFNYRIYYPRIR